MTSGESITGRQSSWQPEVGQMSGCFEVPGIPRRTLAAEQLLAQAASASDCHFE
jgi:hypothetical protein